MTPKRIVIIKADTNDADYVTNEEKLDDEMEAVLRRVAPVIKQHGGAWPTQEWESDNALEMEYEGEISEDDLEYMRDIVPYGEYGCHTIKSIRILEATEERLL